MYNRQGSGLGSDWLRFNSQWPKWSTHCKEWYLSSEPELISDQYQGIAQKLAKGFLLWLARHQLFLTGSGHHKGICKTGCYKTISVSKCRSFPTSLLWIILILLLYYIFQTKEEFIWVRGLQYYYPSKVIPSYKDKKRYFQKWSIFYSFAVLFPFTGDF